MIIFLYEIDSTLWKQVRFMPDKNTENQNYLTIFQLLFFKLRLDLYMNYIYMYFLQIIIIYYIKTILLLNTFQIWCLLFICYLQSYFVYLLMRVDLLVFFTILAEEILNSSVPVTWAPSSKFVAGRFIYTPLSTGPFQNEQIIILYGFALPGANRMVALGLISFNYQVTNPHFYMKIINTGYAMGGFRVNISSNSGSYFTSGPQINYLTVDSTFTQPFSISYFAQTLNPECVGPFNLSYYINFTQSTGVRLNLSNENSMLAFQHIININSPSLCFQIDIVFQVFNQSFYEVRIATTCTMNMSVFGFSRIIFDKTAIQALGFCYFKYGIVQSTNGNVSPLSFTTNSFIGSNFMMGMKSFHINAVNTFAFITTIGTITSVASPINFTYLSFMYWSFKFRVCPPAYPYFQLIPQLCHDICPNGFYANNFTQMCLVCHYSCLTCSAFATCTTCSPTSNRYYINGSCLPNIGYYDNLSTIAVLCSSVVASCQFCINTTSFICQACVVGYYLNNSGTCIVCATSNCLNCNSSNICTTCMPGYIFVSTASICILSSCISGFMWSSSLGQCVTNCSNINYATILNSSNISSCECISGFMWSSSSFQCVRNCSDILHTLNTSSNSSQCLCQINFVWSQNLSICILDSSSLIQISEKEIQWIGSTPCTQQFYIVLKFNNSQTLRDYNKFRFYYNTTQIQQIDNDFVIQTLIYNIQLKSINITLNLLSDLKYSSIILVSSSNNGNTLSTIAYLQFSSSVIPALYSAEQCERVDNLHQLLKIIIIISYCILVLGIILNNKLVGLELLGVLQLAYFSIIQHYSDINLYINKLTQLSITNGYNFIISNDVAQKFYYNMPDIIKHTVPLSGYLIGNTNFIYLVIITIFCIFTILYLSIVIYKNCYLKKFKSTIFQNNQIVENIKISNLTNSKEISYCFQRNIFRFLRQGILSMLFYSIQNITISAVIFFIYCYSTAVNQKLLILSLVGFCIFVLVLTTILIDFIRKLNDITNYGEYKGMFKQNIICRLYIPFSILYRISIAVIIANNIDNLYGTLIPLFISFIYMTYHITNLPYLSTLQNYRSTIIHITQLVILFVANYYRTITLNFPLSHKSHIHTPALVLYGCLVACILVSILSIMYEIFKLVKILVKKFQKAKQQNNRSSKQEILQIKKTQIMDNQNETNLQITLDYNNIDEIQINLIRRRRRKTKQLSNIQTKQKQPVVEIEKIYQNQNNKIKIEEA